MSIGLDTNILCYALDPAFSEHATCRNVLLKLSPTHRVAINPTIVHETYHTLVFGQKWIPSEARKRLQMVLQHPYVEFYNQTKRTCNIALAIAVKQKLGGRDSLILANFLANKIPILYTHDEELLSLRNVRWGKFFMKIKDPTILRF